jgi:hypothetical protein
MLIVTRSGTGPPPVYSAEDSDGAAATALLGDTALPA